MKQSIDKNLIINYQILVILGYNVVSIAVGLYSLFNPYNAIYLEMKSFLNYGISSSLLLVAVLLFIWFLFFSIQLENRKIFSYKVLFILLSLNIFTSYQTAVHRSHIVNYHESHLKDMTNKINLVNGKYENITNTINLTSEEWHEYTDYLNRKNYKRQIEFKLNRIGKHIIK